MSPSGALNRVANKALIAVATLAIASCFLSWRRQVRLQQECERLREALQRKRSSGKDQSDVISDTDGSVGERDRSRGRSTLSNNVESSSSMGTGLRVQPIGMVRSIYRLCVGTPRQGLLAPNARGRIDLFQLGDSSPADSVDGLEGYSHIWIIFVFHLNTQSTNPSKIKSKITPPALGGQRVGIYATRTPHRYNPIGITLCRLDRIVITDKKTVTLHISGLDLVDGTPVLDIKPFVPTYDSVQGLNGEAAVVPNWVEGGLATQRRVVFLDEAKSDLRAILERDPSALEFYGPRHHETSRDETFESILNCIKQVLAIDVRSSYQTKKHRSGEFQAERSARMKGLTRSSSRTHDSGNLCTQQLDNLLISYEITKGSNLKRGPSENSGAEDILSVISIEHLLP